MIEQQYEQVVAFSGGKDSTALVYRLAELGEDFACLFTPTGNELPELQAHLERVIADVKRPLVLPTNRSLDELIGFYGALPNWRQRWCTRQIKIEPCIAWLRRHPGTTLSVGLRADEEARVGLYGEHAIYRYPLRLWGWKIKDVFNYLRERSRCRSGRTARSATASVSGSGGRSGRTTRRSSRRARNTSAPPVTRSGLRGATRGRRSWSNCDVVSRPGTCPVASRSTCRRRRAGCANYEQIVTLAEEGMSSD